MIKFFSRLNALAVIVYLLALAMIGLAPYWPHKYWWLANLIQISPLWIFGLPLVALFLFSFLLKQKKLLAINSLAVFILIFPIMGFQIHFPSMKFNTDRSKIIRAATINLGKTVDLDKAAQYIKVTNPDLIAFQETFFNHREFLWKLLPRSEWDIAFEHELALASRIPIIESELVDRRNIGSWGDVIAKYTIGSVKNPIYFFNVGLESPRKGLEAVIDKKFRGFDEMKETTSIQETESYGASQWAKNYTPALITGDFNQLATSPIYRRHWSYLKNAFSRTGFGFGHTKYTSVHGVRLDHYLYSQEFEALKAVVGPDLGADHRPMYVDLIFKQSDLERIRADSKTNKTEALPDNKNYLVREDFEATKGVFYAGQDNYANLDRRNSFAGKSSMSVSLPSQLNDFSLKVRMPEWDLKKYGTLSFAYLIPQSMPITLRVKTNFDEWVCLGKSGEADCSQIKNAIPATLIDDGTWHEIKIDVRAAMQEMLPALHSLQSVEFYFPRNRHAGDILLIDDFNISGPKQNP